MKGVDRQTFNVTLCNFWKKKITLLALTKEKVGFITSHLMHSIHSEVLQIRPYLDWQLQTLLSQFADLMTIFSTCATVTLCFYNNPVIATYGDISWCSANVTGFNSRSFTDWISPFWIWQTTIYWHCHRKLKVRAVAHLKNNN